MSEHPAGEPCGFDPSGLDVLKFAAAEIEAGNPVAIATLANIEGAAPRRTGAQMAISGDGRYRGSISSGCLERAIVDEARASLRRGEGGIVRYGANSKYIDIVLPCGSGVDILFTVRPSLTVLAEAIEALEARKPVSLFFSANEVASARKSEHDAGFLREYLPPLTIVAAGLGAELIVFSRLAAAAGYRLHVLSPDEATLQNCAGAATRLHSASALPDLPLDPWTAFVTLFHDREWETPLLKAALASDAFFVGAVGSRKTHELRVESLSASGLAPHVLEKLRAPIGLIPSTRDPSSLALSVLADIVAAWPCEGM
ncbi:MAG: XdhC family protein [Parvularculaceae bacterium]